MNTYDVGDIILQLTLIGGVPVAVCHQSRALHGDDGYPNGSNTLYVSIDWMEDMHGVMQAMFRSHYSRLPRPQRVVTMTDRCRWGMNFVQLTKDVGFDLFYGRRERSWQKVNSRAGWYLSVNSLPCSTTPSGAKAMFWPEDWQAFAHWGFHWANVLRRNTTPILDVNGNNSIHDQAQRRAEYLAATITREVAA